MRQHYEEDEPGRRYRGEGYYGGYYGSPRRGEPERSEWSRRGGREDRGFVDRAADEVRSWFGDDEAQRRRRRDEREEGSGWRERERGAADERAWARQWGYVEPRESRGSEWRERGEPRWSDRGEGETRSQAAGGYGDRGWGESRGWGQPERSAGSAPWYGGAGSPERFWGERGADTSTWERREAGQYAGQGPRSYRRSDERICEDVCERLTRHGDIDASDVEVTVGGGEVTLGGRVASRYEKRLAEDLAETVWGIREIHNQIRVGQPESGQARPGEPGQPGQGGQGWTSRAA